MKGSGSLGSGGNRGGPGRKTGGPHPSEGRPSLSFGAGPRGARAGRSGETAENPWRRAALSIERDRERAARHAKAADVADSEALAEGRIRADGRFAIGRLGAPRGTDGDLHVQSYSGESEHFLNIKVVDLERASELLAPARLRLKILRAEEGPGGLTLAFEGYETREAAERLVGMELIVDRAKGAPLAEDEWYVADLVGLRLLSEDGKTEFGQVVAVCEGGSDPLLEVVLKEGRAGAEGAGVKALVPFRKEFVGDIDLEKKVAVLLAPWVLE
ncbi:MAG TPA: ribosome maturation factor RimM [Rectinemataceae bacterium]|nr:ribosome maturation factor RimM [Rectinemataceae bacterium]